MKIGLLLCVGLLGLFPAVLPAQSQPEAACSNCPKYAAFMQQGQEFLKNQVFDRALTEFQAAQVAARTCGCNSATPSAYILEVFKGMQQQKDAAVAAQKRAEKAEQAAKEEKAKTQRALAATEKAKNQAQTALQKADKLISAFYFYDGRFALAYGRKGLNNVFYFIDKNGDEVPKLHRWKKAEQFDYRGLARVKKTGDEADYLLDTLGNTYPCAYDLKDLGPETRALDLAGKKLTDFPAEVFKQPQLEVLLLNQNELTSLPAQIGKLKNLTTLDLRMNPIGNEAMEKIKQLLPNCTIPGFSDRELLQKYREAKYYPKAYDYQKKVLEKDSTDYKDWYNLSFYALFAGKPGEAISAAQKTLELNPEAQGVETYLASAYLLNNQWPEAEKIYLKWKGKSFPGDERLCDEVFLQAIKDLEDAHITHPDFEKVKRMFGK